jgi:KaiC/GvpD/RAD55 family RecA-like ATPase
MKKMVEAQANVSMQEVQAKASTRQEKKKEGKSFQTGIAGLDYILGGGIRWGSSVALVSDLIDREVLLHQIVENALKRGVYVYYVCFKEAPERIKLSMDEMHFASEDYEKKGHLRFYTPLETEMTRRLKNSAEMIKEFDKFSNRLMRDVTIKVLAFKQVLLIFNSYSAIYRLMHEDPKWGDFISKSESWLRRLVKVVSIGLSDLKDQAGADAFNDFCIHMENIDGITYVKATKVSSIGWVPYRSTSNGIEIADEFIVR